LFFALETNDLGDVVEKKEAQLSCLDMRLNTGSGLAIVYLGCKLQVKNK